jgi:hypothetical protein
MTATEKEWLIEKMRDLKKWIAVYEESGQPEQLYLWDSYKFLKIINDMQREIRRLKTEALREVFRK